MPETLNWKIFFTKKSQKQLDTLDKNCKSQIKKTIENKLMINPSLYLKPLLGELGGYYKFIVGNYRLICKKENQKLIITIVEIGHRKKIYKSH